MIDIHSHILPGLDDGARTIGEALQMAKAALDEGIKAIVATPHIVCTGSNGRERILARLREVQEAVAEQGWAISVLPGAELYVEPNLVKEVRAGRAPTINDGPYALVELPIRDYPLYTEQVLFELQVAGIVPILAHPERLVSLMRDISLLFRLVQRGVLAQITAESLIGGQGPAIKGLTEIMLRHNLVHVIASDAHSVDFRPPVLKAAAERAAELIEPAKAWAMVTSVPQAIVEGRPIEVEEPMQPPTRKFWNLWR
ncbi:MAG: tyrosine-protein phosphatase [Chloroflexota bacterium]